MSEKRGPGAGRPTKLTPEVTEKFLTALKAGSYIETAAAYAGIHKDTLYEWLKKGSRDQAEGHSRTSAALFSDAVGKAMADCEMVDLATIRKASKMNWQAAAWRLERRFPDRWGRRSFEVSGPKGGPIPVQDVPAAVAIDLAVLSDEELDLYGVLMEKLSRGADATPPNA